MDCAALCKGGRKNFLKSLLLGLIFKNYELKCLSTIITFCDNFSVFFSPRFSNQMFIAHLLLYYLLFLHGSTTSDPIAAHPLPYLTQMLPGRWKEVSLIPLCNSVLRPHPHANMGTIKYLSSLTVAGFS